MLQVSKYANKLNRFFKDQFESRELHYTVTIQLNFSIDISLFMSDPLSFTKEKLKEEYSKWLKGELVEEHKGEYSESVLAQECEKDFNVFFNTESIRFYVNEFDEPGDPGEGNSGLKWGPRYRLSSLIYREPKEKERSIPPVVTFYSYKGGMGRTTTMMAFALWLAHKGIRIAIIDCDLEAPGYLNFFNLSHQKSFSDGFKNGFVEFMGDCNFLNKKIDISNYTVIPTAPQNNKELAQIYDNIIIVPGGNLNDAFTEEFGLFDNESEIDKEHRKLADENRRDYIEGLSRINLSNPSVVKQNFNTLINLLKQEYEIDIVLIDSRTGFNDIYGSVVFDLADEIVAFFGFSKQTMPGLRQLLDTYQKSINISDINSLGLTICNSILPSIEELNDNDLLNKKWSSYEKDFKDNIVKFCENKNISVPNFFSIHRSNDLEELGMNEQADLSFVQMIKNNTFNDYSSLFDSIYNSLQIKGLITENKNIIEDNEFSSKTDDNKITTKPLSDKFDRNRIRRLRPLQLTKIILRQLDSKLEKVKNFAEQMDIPKKETFLYRDCMKEIFNPYKFIIRGFKGAGKTCIYQALGKSSEVADFIRERSEVPKENSYDFINVISFEGISNHPLKLLEKNGAFEKEKFYNIDAFWQIMMWNAVFSTNKYDKILSKSSIKDSVSDIKGTNGTLVLRKINDMIEHDVFNVLAAIEEDLLNLNDYLTNNHIQLFIMYDGLDNVVMPKHWSKAISPLINNWGGNLSAYSNIHPKIFLRTDLFERIEGTNTERLKDNIIDIDWSVGEVFGYLFKLILGPEECESREAFWTIIRKLRKDTADSMIDNMTRNIKNNGGQFRSLDDKTLKPLVEIFFGQKVYLKSTGTNLGHPWIYFERQLSNAAGKLSMRPFINTLTTDVIKKGLENSYSHVQEIISPNIYASREVRSKVAESYFNDMASEEDFTDDLQKVRSFINSEQGKDFRKKTLTESEFNSFLQQIMTLYANEMNAVESPLELAQLIYASGLMKEVYKPGRKIYKFAPMFEYPWGLQGKSEDEEDAHSSRYNYKKHELEEGKIYEGKIIIKYGNKRIQTDAYYKPLFIRGEILPSEFLEDDIVTFVARKEPDKDNPQNDFWFATEVQIKN